MAASPVLLLSCALLLVGVAGLKLPDYIKQCSRKDPNLNDCALRYGREAIPNFINGDHEYGIPNLDPLYVGEVSVKESGITINARNFTVDGVKDASLEVISFDFDKETVVLKLLVPNAFFNGKYEIAGKIVALPISGNGDFNCTFIDLGVKYTMFFKLKKQVDGEVYLVPQDYEMQFLPKSMKVHFTNLFNGNKLLGDTMNRFMNDNWKLVLGEVGKPSYKALGRVVHQIVQNVAKKVPYKELFSDTE